MRNRLRASARPRRLFEDTKAVAGATGAMKSRARVLDSTPVYDAVATQDTVTQLRAAIRKVLAALDQAGSPVAGAGPRRCCAAMMTTPRRASRRVTGMTRPPAKRWSMSWSTTRWPRWVRWTASCCRRAIEAADLLALVAGQDVERARTGCSGSPAGSPGTG